jgi:hypothetical protein
LLNITGLDANAEITITDVKGQLVLTEISLSKELMTFDLSGCQSGVYFLKIEQNGQNIFRKIVLR